MSNRCPKCGRFIRRGEPICPDCLEAIGRIIQEEVFVKNAGRYGDAESEI